jgi:hypothetical protein
MSTTETTHPLSWLSAICTPDRPGKDDVRAHPWLLEWGGRQQVVATDGRLLVAVDVGASERGFPVAGQQLRQTLLGVMDVPLSPDRDRADAADLAAWCGPHDPGVEEACETCGGGGQCECPRCNGEHDCGACQGTGWEGPTSPCRPGRLFGRRVDCNLLTKAISRLSGPCEVHVGKDILTLVGSGWLVLLAPMTDQGAEVGEPEFTAWAQTKAFTGV